MNGTGAVDAMTTIDVELAGAAAEAYETLVRDVCHRCGPSIDPVEFRFTARYGTNAVLREVVIEISEQEFLLRPGDQLSFDPTDHPSLWLVNGERPLRRIPEQAVGDGHR